MGPILLLYYEESLVSSNSNSKQLRFHGAHPNLDVDSPKINPGVSLRVGGSMVDKRSEKSKKIL